MTEAVTIDGLSVDFERGRSRIAAVDGAGFVIEAGECFGLFGPSGCGKSTILRVLAGIELGWRGNISVFGKAFRSDHKLTGQLRREVQMVFQDPYSSLHPRHTIRRALQEPLVVNGFADPSSRVARILAAVGLPADLLDRTPNALSGGQRQRVAIARALLLEPKLLLLDEPTSALDMSVQAEILNLLNDLKASLGMTFLIVSHDRDVIAHMCDRAVRMRAGRIEERLDRPALNRL